MRAVSIIAAIVVLALTALTLVPEAAAYHAQMQIAAVAAAAILLVAILATRSATTAAAPERPLAEAVKPAPAAIAANQADAEVVSFLATFQERGRLIDFLMDDITAYSDAQVGAAARVVHEGCRSALREHFGIGPVRGESEGSRVSVPQGYAADEYRLVGRISGEAPFAGTLVHRGWKVEWVKLPRVLRADSEKLPTIAPAEVELK